LATSIHCFWSRASITEISHIEDVSREDAGDLALTDIQFRRLLRVYTNYKAEQAKCLEKDKAKPNPPQSTYRTSSASRIVSLPKGMKNLFHTRDGQGNVVVSAESLKGKFNNLYFEQPLNPSQIFSNSFILTMASERFKHSKTLRLCELWCRKERKTRIQLLMCLARSPTIDASSWTPYYLRCSVHSLLKLSSQRYPEVAVLLQQESGPKKALYDPLCKAMESCQNALGLAQEKTALCRKEIDSTLKYIGCGEEVIIEGLFKISTGVKVYCHHPARGLGSKEKLGALHHIKGHIFIKIGCFPHCSTFNNRKKGTFGKTWWLFLFCFQKNGL
jgi:hypothetical protein